jgi:hypothetical protein
MENYYKDDKQKISSRTSSRVTNKIQDIFEL